jgi:hypothetical protein
MKVLVCGSRTFCGSPAWSDASPVLQRLNALPRDAEIIHGDAEGPDRIAHRWAYGLGYVLHVYPADWKRHGRRAGIVRNLRMLDQQPDLVLAFWDRRSNGTGHTIREAQKRGIPVEIVDRTYRAGSPKEATT